jgi:hypothetical protein
MDTLRNRRRAVGLAALLVAFTLAAPMGAHADSAGRSGAAVGEPRAVTPASPASLRDQVRVVAGSADWLVFEQTPSLAGGLSHYGPAADRAVARLVARARGGHQTPLGPMPRHEFSWSVYGNWLVAGHAHGSPAAVRVDEWNLTSGHRSTIRLPSRKDDLVAAAPGGVLYRTPDGTLGRERRGSTTVTTYGTPFGATKFFSGVAGPDGAVLLTEDAAKYVSFAQLAQPQALDTPQGGGDVLVCKSVDASYAGCYSYDDTTDSTPVDQDLLVPLDGGAAAVTTECVGPDAVTGATIVWGSGTRGGSCRDSGYPTLMSLHVGDSAPLTSTTTIDGDIGTAYGQAVAPQPRSLGVRAASSATDSHLLFRTPRSRVTTGSFALSAGQLFDADDQAGTRADLLATVRMQTAAATARSVRLTHRHVVGRAPHGRQVDTHSVSASAGGVAYAVIADPAGATEQIRVRSPLGDATVSGVQIDAPFILSGGRLIYMRANPLSWHLYDVVAHSDRAVANLSSTDYQVRNSLSVALSGDNLYTQVGHRLYDEDLLTGKKTFLATSGGLPLYAVGDHVAWGQASHASYLKVRTGSAVHTIRHAGFIVGVSSAGMLLKQRNGAIRLRRWGGGSDRLLGGSAYLSSGFDTVYPQLDGHLMAWIDAHGRLRAASTRYALARPQYLGDPRTSNALSDGGRWLASLPYTEPLTSCHATITRHGRVVRRIACDAALMRAGLARVSWNGTDSHGNPAASGVDHWALRARGAAGTALDASGGLHGVHGSVRVP